MRRFSESLPMLLLRARETALARFRPILHRHGLTEQQWRVLRALNDLGELTAAGLAQECAILAPSMTRILRRLTADGFVRTTRSRDDQREVRVRLAPKGQRLVGQIGPQVEYEYAEICDRLGAETLDSLYEGLEELITLGDQP
jgi:homoprotocatechuate degradation regulator HpaR